MAKKKTRRGRRRRRSASDANQSDLASCAGQGPLVGNDAHHSRVDSRLIERAIRQRWPISEDVKPELIDRQVEIAKGADSGRATAAFRAVLAADRMNQIDEQAETPTQHVHGHVFVNAEQARLAEIASELGLQGVLKSATGCDSGM